MKLLRFLRQRKPVEEALPQTTLEIPMPGGIYILYPDSTKELYPTGQTFDCSCEPVEDD